MGAEFNVCPGWKASGRRLIDEGAEGDIESAGYDLLSATDEDPNATIRVVICATEPAVAGYKPENDEWGVGPFAGYIDPVEMAEFLIRNGYASPVDGEKFTARLYGER